MLHRLPIVVTLLLAAPTLAAAPPLPLEEAKELDFWNYYSVSGEKPIWGTHLFRYLRDESVALILTDLKDTVRDEKTRIVVHNLLEADFSDVDVPR